MALDHFYSVRILRYPNELDWWRLRFSTHKYSAVWRFSNHGWPISPMDSVCINTTGCYHFLVSPLITDRKDEHVSSAG
ncbi:hypothetical Protein YC6258_03424 [Gynuella sunshinyii YC6258]|uniref:Uncharacterized protein n=1 Tax=Gynuella sunshinyii YC6258 TaxID=1445510 RepID=A0A0C5V7R0_9GAMM|nr:hypothetical Protein YC6258_03424 [Gynuella sunshinyii YC6258]